MDPLISFVIPCKGRLQHLRRTLPLVAGISGTECVVVDYSCPDGTGTWVRSKFPEARIVDFGGSRGFNLAHARNLGAAAARGQFLCFLDADYMVAADFFATVKNHLDPGRFIIISDRQQGASGFLLCPQPAFAQTGYDTGFTLYGREDTDIVLALDTAGLEGRRLCVSFVRAIPHEEKLRTQFYKEKDLKKSMALMDEKLFAKWKTPLPLIREKFRSYPMIPETSRCPPETETFGEKISARIRRFLGAQHT